VVLGKRASSVVLVAVGVTVFCWVLLLAEAPSGAQAQTPGGTTGGTNQHGQAQAEQSDEGCSNSLVVETFSGSNSQITSPFEITGNTFRLTLEAEPVRQGEHASIFIESFEETEGNIPFGNLDVNPVEGQVTQTANVLEGPGTFNLEIEANNTRYEITVEDCGGRGGTTGGGTTGGGTTEETTQRRDGKRVEVKGGGVTIINIPSKPLPPTGGLPANVLVAGFVFAGAGLFGLGLAVRRAHRRRKQKGETEAHDGRR
jgi:hypothetical protein